MSIGYQAALEGSLPIGLSIIISISKSMLSTTLTYHRKSLTWRSMTFQAFSSTTYHPNLTMGDIVSRYINEATIVSSHNQRST